MVAGYDIAQLKGTPLYDLARNANVYGGKTLSKTEMVFFQQQCREMGFDPAKYGLEVATEDLECADYKETQKAQKDLTNSIDRAYQNQFGKKNNAIETAKNAETKAYAIINTAKEAFVKNHGEMNFSPESLGQRPNFIAPEYKDNLTKYVSDLTAWGNKVAEQYRNADNMTNEQLAAMIMKNSDKNAVFNAEVTVATAESLMKELQDGTAQIIKQVKIEGGATRVAIKNAKGEIINAIRTAEGNIMSEVQFQGGYSRQITIDQGQQTRNVVAAYGEANLAETMYQGETTRTTVKNTAQQTQELNGISEKITVNMSNAAYFHKQDTMDRVNNMRNKILQSNVPYEQKKELLTHLAAFSTQTVINGNELTNEEARIDKSINNKY